MKLSNKDQFLRDHMNIILRKAPPTKSSKECYATQWHVIKKDEPTVVYVQISKDETQCKWERFSNILELYFLHKTEDPVFMEEAISLFTYKKNIA